MKRRQFLKTSGAIGAGITILNFPVFGKLAPSNKVVLGFAGLNGRGSYLAELFQQNPQVTIGYLCDVEQGALAKGLAACKNLPKAPVAITDIHNLVERKDVDAVVVAIPDHWHTPATILCASHGKHVYVEKPGSHNGYEAKLLMSLPKKHQVKIQLGNQRRSFPSIQQAVKEVKDGLIGRTYFGKAWYSNNRAPIGFGKKIPVPGSLNWELWQGPAPRADLLDNLVHYNWHWRWIYGTGEACNNGTHEIDCCRWFMDLEYPVSVQSAGGRLSHQDDWECPDTQIANFTFADRKMITWEGRSSKTFQVEPSSRGFTIFGEGGTLVNEGGGDYKIYDKAQKLIKQFDPAQKADAANTLSSTGNLDLFHTNNFIESIQGKASLQSPVEESCKSILLCHLANISVRAGEIVRVDPTSGEPAAKQELWSRKYDPSFNHVMGI